MEYTFISLIGNQIKDFILQKRASGFPYQSSARILRHFDLMVAENFPYEKNITKEMCSLWMQLKPGEHRNGLSRRITPVRQLSKYLMGFGYDAYIIPSHISAKQIKYEAHIYTTTELKAFFAAIDRCPPSPFSPTRRYVIPVIFRMLFCCGLRSSKVRLLMKEDVDLVTGKIIIRESKGWRARIIYMSDDLREVCVEYDQCIDVIHPERRVFFPNKDGNYYSDGMIDYWFHEFWDNLSEARNLTGNPARVHDFRNTHINKIRTFLIESQKHIHPGKKGSDNKFTTLAA